MRKGQGCATIPFVRSSSLTSQNIKEEAEGYRFDSETLIQKLHFIKKQIFEIEEKAAEKRGLEEEQGSLQDSEREISKITAVIDKKKCVSCGVCVDNCPEQAISMNYMVVIDSVKCNGCGICAEVCPNEAIALSGMMKFAAS